MTWTAMPHLDTIAGLDVVVSPGLPMRPSPGEEARRMVRHGFNDAGLYPAAAGPVGPKPTAWTRAILAGGTLLVDRLLAMEIRDATTARRDRAAARSRRLAQERADHQLIATVLGVRHVSAIREPDRGRTTYHAHLEAEGEQADTVQVRYDDGELARHRNTTALIAQVASDLYDALNDRRLNDKLEETR